MSTDMKTLVWLRNDLRLSDNPALHRAMEADGGCVAVFVWCAEFVSRHSIAPVRIDFVRRHLQELAPRLASLGVPLQMLGVDNARDIPAALVQLAQAHQCRQLFFNAEYPLDELARDKAAVAAFRALGFETKRFHDRVMVPPGMIRNGQGDPYKVFTAFKRKWLEVMAPVDPRPLPVPKIRSRTSVPAPQPAGIDALFASFEQRELASLWPAGEAEAQARLDAFIRDGLHGYQDRRDFPAQAATSQLSPYLAVGAISVRQCLHAALAANGGRWQGGSEGASCWITELIWREFYQHVVVDFPQVCMHKAMQTHTETFPWRHDQSRFERWCEGDTGIPIVDAAMRQLRDTGWMHNRLRMVVAMFLSKNLQIDWRRGEDFFMRNLIDGDFAANNGGWQWSASTGTDAAPYFRIFNPVSQSQRFDPEGEFIRGYVPELAGLPARAIHSPPPVPGYPTPMVDLAASRKETIALFARLGG